MKELMMVVLSTGNYQLYVNFYYKVLGRPKEAQALTEELTMRLLYLTMSSQENIRIVRRVIEAFNTGDTSNVHDFVSPDYL